jgi:hypothetical protein
VDKHILGNHQPDHVSILFGLPWYVDCPSAGAYYRLFEGAGPNTNYQFIDMTGLHSNQPPIYNVSFGAMSTAHGGNADTPSSHDDVVLNANGTFQILPGQTYQPAPPFMRYESVGYQSYVTHAGDVPVRPYQFTYYWATYVCSNYCESGYFNQQANWAYLGDIWQSMAPANVQSTNTVVQTNLASINFYAANLHLDPTTNDIRWFGPIFFCFWNTNQNLSAFGGH